ncbi:helix-turn-helix transcriptional regulator [Azotosporobacter soli]|uniref:helix-turn-helix transcriptional regulator n=1 Tax=Azotosporobacter soli TaxID=3055040 RepID=UPI0031FF0803
MSYKKKLAMYIPLVDFIADIIGSHCEVLLHDIVDAENSVIAIRNGYISGRYLGCPLTDLGFKLLENKGYQGQNSLVNYRSRTDSGEKLISSTYYIKDEEGTLIGMLCVNILNSPENQASKILGDSLTTLLQNVPVISEQEEVTESLTPSLDLVVEEAFKKVSSRYKVPVERMSSEEKSAIVQELSKNGIFKIKGAIPKVAIRLKSSESTIYRYLSNK